MSTYDMDINPVLEGATNDELQMLAKQMEGRISSSLQFDKECEIARKTGDYTKFRSLLAAEFREFGGNTMANATRRITKGKYQGPPYKEIVYDVAKKLKVNPGKDMSCEHMERLILDKVIKKAWGELAPEEQKELLKSVGGKGKPTYSAFFIAMRAYIKSRGFMPYKITTCVINGVSRKVLGHGLRYGTGMKLLATTLGKSVSVLLWGWFVNDIASPAFRVTVPCVVIIALSRQRQLAESRIVFCSKCANECDKADSYCPKCGTKLGDESTGDEEDVS